jgi:hypothetical protein
MPTADAVLLGDDCADPDDNTTDLVGATGSFFAMINYKLIIIMFLIGVIIFSDLFIEKFLTGFNGAVDGETPTSKGTMIQVGTNTAFMGIFALMIDLKWL